MNLTGKQIVEQGIVTGPIDKDNIQQHGVDLNLIAVSLIAGSKEMGAIYCGSKKTKLSARIEEPLISDINKFWFLDPGVYEITFAQGCKIPANQRMQIIHRSSLFRNGGQLVSALFDAGFETQRIGTVMIIHTPIRIDWYARVGQAYTTSSNTVENLYDGQFQNDKQRNV